MRDEKTQEDLDVELFINIVKSQPEYDADIDGEEAPDDVKRIAKQFAAAVRQAAVESCAKICEEEIECYASGWNDGKPWKAKRDGSGACAKAIRERMK